MAAWTGKMAIINLADQKIRVERIPDDILKNFLGGRGLGVRLFFEFSRPEIDPLSPENPLIFTVGPLTGLAPMSGRHSVVSKSPLTGTIFDSNSGGNWGKELKYAGYDAVVVLGKASEPVFLSIEDENIDIYPANSLWGKNVRETTKLLENKGSVACIGRAGERGVMFASIMNDYTHAAGRGGLGYVMGSKNLKAIVVKGHTRPEVADKEEFKTAMYEFTRLLEASPPLNKGLRVFGTAMLFEIVNYLEVLPTDNFNRSHFEDSKELTGDAIFHSRKIKSEGCWGCPIKCKKKDAISGTELPEYETIWAFGPNIENPDYEKIVRVNRICNDYGMDTISAGVTTALYRELKKEVSLENFEDVGENRHEIAMGTKRLAEKYAAEKLAIHIKGLELAGYDPRGLYGQALSYATSNRGGCHLRAYMVAPEIIGKPKLIHRLSPEGKAGLVVIFQNLNAAVDSLIICKFSTFAVSEVEFSKLLRAATGINYRGEDILRIGERIYNLERIFNIRAGFSGKDDTLPEKIFRGENALAKDLFKRMLDEYYEFREWENGVPRKEKLKKLGIDRFARF